MFQALSAMTIKIGDRVFLLTCDPTSTLGEVYDALTQMRTNVVDLINQQEPEKKKEAE